jgi:hypothetical protein
MRGDGISFPRSRAENMDPPRSVARRQKCQATEIFGRFAQPRPARRLLFPKRPARSWRGRRRGSAEARLGMVMIGATSVRGRGAVAFVESLYVSGGGGCTVD